MKYNVNYEYFPQISLILMVCFLFLMQLIILKEPIFVISLIPLLLLMVFTELHRRRQE